jgi:hypothetical protein
MHRSHLQDGSTALSIAVENGHRDVAVLIYAHLNYGRKLKDNNSSPSIMSQSMPADTSVNIENASAEAPC